MLLRSFVNAIAKIDIRKKVDVSRQIGFIDGDGVFEVKIANKILNVLICRRTVVEINPSERKRNVEIAVKAFQIIGVSICWCIKCERFLRIMEEKRFWFEEKNDFDFLLSSFKIRKKCH